MFTISTKQVLWFLYILAWIIFVGVCIDAGGFISNTFVCMVINPGLAKNFWTGLDLSALYNYDKGHFLVQCTYMCLVGIIKAIMFYSIIKVLHDKKLSISKPFSKASVNFVITNSILALFISFFSNLGAKYAKWLATKGIAMPNAVDLHVEGADIWLFMAVILFIIAQVFKRGIELQSDNDLTI